MGGATRLKHVCSGWARELTSESSRAATDAVAMLAVAMVVVGAKVSAASSRA